MRRCFNLVHSRLLFHCVDPQQIVLCIHMLVCSCEYDDCMCIVGGLAFADNDNGSGGVGGGGDFFCVYMCDNM